MKPRVTPIFDGSFQMPMHVFPQMQANPAVTRALMGLTSLPEDVTVPVWAFLIEHSGSTMLVDAGGGALMGPGFGGVIAALRAAGIATDSVDRVFLTHLHGDHCGGLIDDAGNPTFPNARIAVSEPEVNFWNGPQVPHEMTDIAADANRALDAYTARIDHAAPGDTIDGAKAIDAKGHTPGHIGWYFPGAGVLAAGDIVHLGSVQITRPDWGSAWDMDPKSATESRQNLIRFAQQHKLDLLCAHAGRISPDE